MPNRTISIGKLMESSGVKFGTSGLAVAMTDEVCYTHFLAFLQYLEINNEITPAWTYPLAAICAPVLTASWQLYVKLLIVNVLNESLKPPIIF